MIRSATAVRRGTGRAGNGSVSTDSGVLADTPIRSEPASRMRKAPIRKSLCRGACRTLHHGAGVRAAGRGFTPTELTTEAAVTLEPQGQGFRISRSALTLRAQIANLDETTFARIPDAAEKNCPVSKVLKLRSPWTPS